MSVIRNICKTLIVCGLIVFSSEIVTAQTATLTVNEDDKISQLLTLKKELEADNELSEGYTIQLYYGSRNTALAKEREYRNKYANWPVSIKFETPNYKVWVGDFTNRIEADRALIEVQRNFPSAFILKPAKRKRK